MQQAPSTQSTLAAAATEAIEEDASLSASLPEKTENNIAKMVHSNSEDKENPTQPSAQIKQKGSSKKKMIGVHKNFIQHDQKLLQQDYIDQWYHHCTDKMGGLNI